MESSDLQSQFESMIDEDDDDFYHGGEGSGGRW
jgi:hypothetical protein